jgi:hypothetical protein
MTLALSAIAREFRLVPPRALGRITCGGCPKMRRKARRMDRWALRSQQRFAAAQAAGKFEHEIIAVN